MTAIKVRLSAPGAAMGEAPPEQVIDAVFWDAATGADVPVKIRLFQIDTGRVPFGAGVYMTDEAGEPQRGTVLRWDNGPAADPVVIHWEAPHCADDDCGSLCSHRKAGRS